MLASTLNLVVLKASDIERTRTFYAALGLNLVQEKHGAGPVHYACDFGTIVLEIYPAKMVDAEPEKVRLGFNVDSLEHVVDRVRALGCTIVTLPTVFQRGIRAVVLDPDGRKVELVERSHQAMTP